MDLETLANQILDDPIDDVFDDYENDFLEHHGVKGMKWGVRKDRKSIFTRKRDRRYDDETDKEYQARMNREFQERSAKARAKEQANSEKRASKERIKLQKAILKSQEKQQKLQAKTQREEAERKAKQQREEADRKAKQQKDEAERKEREQIRASKEKSNTNKNVKSMSDQDLSSALNRLRQEKSYLDMKKDVNKASRGAVKAGLIGAGTVAGGVLLAVGKEVAKKQLTELGNQRLEDYLVKHNYMKKPEKGNNQTSEEKMKKMIEKLMKEMDK